MGSERHSLASIPSIDRLLGTPWAESLLERNSREFVVTLLRRASDETRSALRAGELVTDALEREIERRARREEERLTAARLPRVVNATGVVLHTNLGRALLPEAALAAMATSSREAVALELDLASGRRGERDHVVEGDLLALTGAEAATVVNNNAAAVLIALNTLADGREVIVSRGELIEIGGSFRMPDVLAKSGARLREVGTTNRTHATDYERAIGPDTAALVKVHTSNYRIVGFTAEVPLEELVAIGRRHKLPVIEDLGSGAIVDLTRWGLPKEPVVAERITAGADVVTFSGDKLLGGPQAGILVGRREAIEPIRSNPLRRALRPGKAVLAALSEVLRLYRRSPRLERELPVLRMLTCPVDELAVAGRDVAERLREVLGKEYRIDLVESAAEIGSGSLPTHTVPSLAIAIEHRDVPPDRIARRFREARPPIVGRIRDDRFLLDLRSTQDPASLVPSF